ncbi:MAG: alpha-amylase family glycosyl hydrolase [Rubrivivax sp.]|nr:alpha-amylase family glycosyl hydrolase [Rubrivivax sp.]
MRLCPPRRPRLLAAAPGAAPAAAFAAAFALLAGPAPAQTPIDTHLVPATDLASHLPAALRDGWQHGAFMEIFVRAYRDSDGDGIGDLRGLTQSLDYLQALGIRGLWLMPITANADGDHGYATTDYRAIAPEYGTLADFDELLAQAHRRGIGVVMDYVINHSAAQHPMFQAALNGPASPFHDWFVWSSTMPAGWDIWGKNPWYAAEGRPWNFLGDVKDLPPPPPGAQHFYFGTFGPQMPDFNFRNASVLSYHQSSLRFWLNRGLDGYRLDAVPHLVETDAKDWNDQPLSRQLTKQFQDLIKGYEQRYVVCEATAEPLAYGDPAVCGGAFAFGFVQHYLKAAQGDAASVQQVASYFRAAPPTMATFLSSHDIFAGRRVWDQLGGEQRAYRLAAAGYLLQPGTPFIYYGEEIGQAGVPDLAGDLPLRSPMSWTADPVTGGFTSGRPFRPLAPNLGTHNVAVQQADPQSLLNFYKAMLKLRNTLPSVAQGSFEHGFAQGLVAGWQRSHGNERTLVLINYGRELAQAQIPKLPPRARLLSAFPEGGAVSTRADAQGQASLWLGPQSLRVLVVDTRTAKAGTAGKPKGKARAKGGAAPKKAGKAATKKKAAAKKAPAKQAAAKPHRPD